MHLRTRKHFRAQLTRLKSRESKRLWLKQKRKYGLKLAVLFLMRFIDFLFIIGRRPRQMKNRSLKNLSTEWPATKC